MRHSWYALASPDSHTCINSMTFSSLQRADNGIRVVSQVQITTKSLVTDQSTVRVTPLCNRARTLERVKPQDPSRDYYLLSFEEVRLYDSTCWLYIEIQIGSPAIMAVGDSKCWASVNLEPYLRCVFRELDIHGSSLLRPNKRR